MLPGRGYGWWYHPGEEVLFVVGSKRKRALLFRCLFVRQRPDSHGHQISVAQTETEKCDRK